MFPLLVMIHQRSAPIFKCCSVIDLVEESINNRCLQGMSLGGNDREVIGDTTKDLIYKGHMIQLLFMMHLFMFSISYNLSHKYYQLKIPELWTKYLIINISLC